MGLPRASAKRVRRGDVANQLLLDLGPGGRTSYGYDASGNRSRQESAAALTLYTWDARNRLASAEPAAGPVTFSHDATGKRVRKQTPTATRRFLFDADNLLREDDGSGGGLTQYTMTAQQQYGDLVSAYGGGLSSYYEFDALGRARLCWTGPGRPPTAGVTGRTGWRRRRRTNKGVRTRWRRKPIVGRRRGQGLFEQPLTGSGREGATDRGRPPRLHEATGAAVLLVDEGTIRPAGILSSRSSRPSPTGRVLHTASAGPHPLPWRHHRRKRGRAGPATINRHAKRPGPVQNVRNRPRG